MKRAVTILLHNEDGDILAVSRKDNPNDFGLPGGSVEAGETDEAAIIREVKEETGLDVYGLTPYFIREEENGYTCTTFVGNYAGQIITAETGIVKWTNFGEIKNGSFGKYNGELESYFIHNNKYSVGQKILNPETGEIFRVISFHEKTTINFSGYFVDTLYSTIGKIFIHKSAIDNIRMHRYIDEHDNEISKYKEAVDMIGVAVFDNLSIIYACKAHLDVNQYYETPFGDLLYSFHLKSVANVGKRFKHFIPDYDWNTVEAAAWCHDLSEDARISLNALIKNIGEKSALIVYAVTNEKGKNRSERANDKYYDGIKNTQYATFVKLCDRIANVEFGIKTNSSMVKKYKKEFEHFRNSLHINGEYEEMWNHLNELMIHSL